MGYWDMKPVFDKDYYERELSEAPIYYSYGWTPNNKKGWIFFKKEQRKQIHKTYLVIYYIIFLSFNSLKLEKL